MLYLYRFCDPAAEWSRQDSYSALLWPSRDTCCHSRRCSPHRSLQGNRYSQSVKPSANIHHRCHLGPFNSSHRNGPHAHWWYIKKEKKWSSMTVSIHFSARDRKQSRVLAPQWRWNKEQSQMRQLDEINGKKDTGEFEKNTDSKYNCLFYFPQIKINSPLYQSTARLWRSDFTQGWNHQFLSVLKKKEKKNLSVIKGIKKQFQLPGLCAG